MLAIEKLEEIATNELIRVFGKEYLQKNYSNTCKSVGAINDSMCLFFIGIKSKKDLPHRQSNLKDWVVYGIVTIDSKSGEIIDTQYELE